MEREEIQSSVIASAGYDEDRQVLEIKFRTGRIYHYRQVPRAVYETFMTADSAGKYFNDVIRTSYEGELVYDPGRPRLRT